MKIVQSYSEKQDFSTGRHAQATFARSGKINIIFYVYDHYIGASIEGFNLSIIYKKDAKSVYDIKRNDYFLSKYVGQCHNSEELLTKLNLTL